MVGQALLVNNAEWALGYEVHVFNLVQRIRAPDLAAPVGEAEFIVDHEELVLGARHDLAVRALKSRCASLSLSPYLSLSLFIILHLTTSRHESWHSPLGERTRNETNYYPQRQPNIANLVVRQLLERRHEGRLVAVPAAVEHEENYAVRDVIATGVVQRLDRLNEMNDQNPESTCLLDLPNELRK